MNATWWAILFTLVALTAALFYGGKRWIAARDPDALRRFYDRPLLPLILIAATLLTLLILAALPLVFAT